MNYTYLHFQIGLSLIYGVGPIRARALLNLFDSPEEIFTLSASELARSAGLTNRFVHEMERESALEKAVSVVEHMERNSIQAVYYTDANFPRRLNNCPDAPLLLYSKGNFNYNSPKMVAVVGTRNATPYGNELCRTFIESLQDTDVTVVSGLAKGIDASIHRFCLEFDVPTIGVLGHGLDRIYPGEHRALAKSMLSNGGLVTEFIPGTDPDRENFPKRNRIVAGLCDATIVVESKNKGGSLITAQLANDYNRDVFAFPGNVTRTTSEGCNALIASQQAHLLSSPQDFLRMMGWKTDAKTEQVQRSMFQQLNAQQQQIVEVIANAPGSQIDIISVKTALPISFLNTELFRLEMDGVIRSLPGKAYAIA